MYWKKNIERQHLLMSINTDMDDWQQVTTTTTTEQITDFEFNSLVEKPEDNMYVASPTTPKISLETFIAEDFEILEPNMSLMNEENNPVDDEQQYDPTEKITTEDILGNISESDSSDDEDANNPIEQDPSKHKHAKKRLKTSHPTSSDAAALQLSEDEL